MRGDRNQWVVVTITEPLEKSVWSNKKDPENKRNKILNRTEDPYSN